MEDDAAHVRSERRSAFDVVVIGGGVIGLSVAWRCSGLGMRVAVVDPAPGHGASWAAAGMLAPVTEVHYGEETLLRLNLASCKLWPSFVEELQAASECDTGYLRCGTLVVALEEGDRVWLEELFEFERDVGLEVEWMGTRGARDLEPNLSPNVRAAMLARGDHQIDNRLLVRALIAAIEKSGCSTYRDKARSVEYSGGNVEGVVLAGGEFLSAPNVVLAAGAWSTEIDGLPAAQVPPVRPVKGQILRLLTTQGQPLLGRSVRGIVNGRAVYCVPRSDGTVVLGATVEERGFDTSVTVGAVYEMLRDAHRFVPGIGELELLEAIAGLRPGSPDNAPMLGSMSSPEGRGLIHATGHYRNGILLAPITANAVTAMLTGSELPAEVAPFTAARFQMSSW